MIEIVICAVSVAVAWWLARAMWSYYYLNCMKDEKVDLPLPPGTMGLPFIGETMDLAMKKDFWEKKYEKYGNIYKTHVLGSPVVRVTSSEFVSTVLRGENTLVKIGVPRHIEELLGDCGALSVMTGPKHTPLKQVFYQVLSGISLGEFCPRMQEVVRSNLDMLLVKKNIAVYEEIKTLNFQASSKLLLGEDRFAASEMDKIRQAAVEFMGALFTVPWNIPGFPVWKARRGRQTINSYIGKAIDSNSNDIDNGDAISHLLKAALPLHCRRLTKDDIYTNSTELQPEYRRLTRMEVMDAAAEMLFMSSISTSSAMTSIVLLLGQHQEVREKILAELGEHGLLMAKDDVNIQPLTTEKLTKLKYVQCVIKEVLRLKPPVGGVFRKVLQTLELGGYQIPRGWTVICSIKDMQENSQVFKDGQNFNPERWLHVSPEESKQLRFENIPFGGGHRVCPGRKFAQQLLQIFTIELVARCNWELTNPNPTMARLPVLHPVDSLPAVFSPRRSRHNHPD
ncbi:cytochrome P450 26A1 [Lingula anatina]|uniref:Cytochrome P450 26A1 n=1 Tax=Lingula anatina TaxID=7574 RepID=A0A1S3JU38_LINAN|nr:cytochrome P450 26A1 [Lingula anatina]|eukprot:XP_013413599.1 cytochrome P450 26A1 [Lingula anatina]